MDGLGINKIMFKHHLFLFLFVFIYQIYWICNLIWKIIAERFFRKF